jgi:hypothetical protein
MNRAEADAECDRLRREHPDRDRLVFAVREVDAGNWEVVIAQPHGVEVDRGELHAETRASPEVTPDPTEGQAPPIHSQRGY